MRRRRRRGAMTRERRGSPRPALPARRARRPPHGCLLRCALHMSDGLKRGTVRQTPAVVDEIMRGLGDPALRTSQTWWHYFFVVAALGAKVARRVARDVPAVEAQGGMTTQDGRRRRTPGGVFFALAKERLGPERMKAARGCAARCSEEESLKKFLRLLETLSAASMTVLAVGAEPERPRPPPPSAPPAPAEVHAGASPTRSAAAVVEPASVLPAHAERRAPGPTRSSRPPPDVEIVVRRRSG